MTNKTLTSLTSRINQEAGLEVFLVEYTKKFNDWPQNEAEYTESYVKAIKNRVLEHKDGNIYGTHIHQAIFDKFHNHNNYRDGEKNNTIFYGMFPTYLTIKTPKTRIVKERKLWGLGGTKDVIEHYVDVKSTPGAPLRMLPLTTYRESDDLAYFAEMTIKSLHGYGRGQHPRLTIIGNQKLIEDSVSYLRENPKDYIDFIKGVLPAEEFPKINEGIVKKADSTRGILFVECNKWF